MHSQAALVVSQAEEPYSAVQLIPGAIWPTESAVRMAHPG